MLRRRRPEGEAEKDARPATAPNRWSTRCFYGVRQASCDHGTMPSNNRACLPPSPCSLPARTAASAALSPGAAFALLAAARLISALLNIIHDCDETYNYLEPLHFVLYGSGMQTWEYGAQYALRAYIYLLLHSIPAAPALLLGAGRGEALVLGCAAGNGEHASC